MGKYVIKRVLMAVLTLFIVICLTFFLMNAVPGSPWLSERTPSQATIDALNAKYGLDKPVIVQLGPVSAGPAPRSISRESLRMQRDRPVLDIILTMFPISASIGAIAIGWAILVGRPIGLSGRVQAGHVGGQPAAGHLYPGHIHARLRGGHHIAAYPDGGHRGGQPAAGPL